MKRYNTIELIRQIKDKELFESVYAGFKTIYENGVSMTIKEMEHDTYPEALALMNNYFTSIDDKIKYSNELDQFAMEIYHAFREHQSQMTDSLDTLNFNELKLVINTVNTLIHQVSGENTFEEYTRILKNKIQIFVDLFGTSENMTRVLNEFIESEKFNALFHRVKDHFVPYMKTLK